MEGKLRSKMEGIENAVGKAAEWTLKIRAKFETNLLQLYVKE